MNEKNKSKKPLNKFVRLSGIGFQMITIICLFSFFGVWLDEKSPNKFSAYSVLFSLLGVALAMYFVIKQVINISQDK